MSKRIGKYEITAEIGRGGFSRVYRGFDPNVNRPVAIKVSTRESDPEHLSRFRNEASAAGNLRHENIVTIHDYGDDDGVPYLVMELLEGRDLHHIMRDGPKFSMLEKMQVMSQVAQGLHCAHLNGVVHRDIKPANVMVLADGTVKILDFGIARMTGEVSRLTQNGYLVGTPLYMSPEQLQGSEADALGDVWAYGVLYFELLTGQHPFLSQDNTRLIRNITIVNPPSVHALTRGIPEGLAQVIRRALTKDRRRRYQSLEDVLVDTNPILALLQREQTAGLVTEAQYYRNSGQLIAARRSSRRALEIDPSNYGAQQLLKSIQQEMQEESLAEPPRVALAPLAKAPVEEKRQEPVAPPPPPTPMPAPPVAEVIAQPVAPPVAVWPQDEPEMMLPEREPEPVAAVIPEPVVAAIAPEPVMPIPVPTPVPAPAPAPMVAVAEAPVVPQLATAVETPAPTNPTRSRPVMASGAAAAIAAAVAAAKARQAEEEKQQKEKQPEREEASTPAVRATPLAVSALPTTRVAPPPPPTGSFRRPENGSGIFVTEDPLVVKRPAAAVMTQRMNAESTAAVATPTPAPPPPTRLPGTRAIPPSVQRSSNGTAETKTPTPAAPQTDRRPAADNLPMRRPPSEVYAKGKRRKSSSSLFAEKKPGKAFPWALVIFGLALASVAGALFFFSWSAPKYASAPALLPEKMIFSWKPVTAFPPEQLLTLKGGPANATYTATSDEDWLVVTPEAYEGNNRTWQIKVEPDKLATTGPSTNTGWIDVTSGEGFKTQAEVTLKVGAMEATPPTKSKKTPATTPKADQTPSAVTTVAAPTTKPLATVTSGTSATDSAKTVVAKPAAKKLDTSTKKPANDGNEPN